MNEYRKGRREKRRERKEKYCLITYEMAEAGCFTSLHCAEYLTAPIILDFRLKKNSKKLCPFFFLDKKEPKNGGCEKMAKNAALRLNRAKLASNMLISCRCHGLRQRPLLRLRHVIFLTPFSQGRSLKDRWREVPFSVPSVPPPCSPCLSAFGGILNHAGALPDTA